MSEIIDQLRKMSEAEEQLAKELDNEYKHPSPPIPMPVQGENNSGSIFLPDEEYSTGRLLKQTIFDDPLATTTTTIRQTTTTTTTISGFTSTSTSSTSTTSTTLATTTTTTSTTTSTSTTLPTTTTSTSTTTTSSTTLEPTTTTTSSTSTTTTTLETTTTTTSSTSTTTTTLETTTTTTSSTTSTTTTIFTQSRFNFNPTAQSVSSWTDVSGQPNLAVINVTDSSTGISVSSIATNKWLPSGGNTAVSGGETVANPTFIFPSAVTATYWFSNQSTWAVQGANLEISGLVVGGTYRIEILGSRIASAVSQADRLTAYYCQDANGLTSNEAFNVKGNTANVHTFDNKVANASGKILLGIHQPPSGTAGNGYLFGYLNGMRITRI